MSRYRRPEETLLHISQGDWLLVKKHLTAKETRSIHDRMIKKFVQGEQVELDPMQAGLSQMVEYLLDWSIKDVDEKPVVIRNKPPKEIEDALNGLPFESYLEIREVIEAHVAAMDKERELEKNAQTGVSESKPISPSPDGVDGAMSGSENSTLTSTTSL